MKTVRWAALCAAVVASANAEDRPRYTETNELIRPEGYREWMFVGANYGMGYTEGEDKAKKNDATFHNIYLPRAAYQEFVKTGKFPDPTMLVMEVVRPATNASINKRGVFQNELVGIEVALKDSKRLPDTWGYFNFIGKEGKALATAKPFAKNACWDCHNKHGAVDNVFVQFYPALRDARK